MNFKRFLVGATVSAVLLGTMATNVFASTGLGDNWRVFNGMPATAKFWDINPTKAIDGVITFPIQQFESKTTGSFVIYLYNNYNVDMTDKTLSAAMSWAPGTYKTRSTVFPGAFVRFEFQDVTSGIYGSNDYWWSTGSNSLDLNADISGNLSVSLANRTLWTNVCGQSATDTTAHPGPNCVGSVDPAVSPYDGFTNAMKNVKQVGLGFGSAGSYASGVALDGETGAFTVSSFTIN
jgi:hypothetical protein